MKKFAMALAAFALVSSTAGAALAEESSMSSMTPAVMPSSSIADCNAISPGNGTHPSDWNTTPLANKLSKDGVKFSSISTFGNCFSVASIQPNGKTQVQLYDPSTLDRVAL